MKTRHHATAHLLLALVAAGCQSDSPPPSTPEQAGTALKPLISGETVLGVSIPSNSHVVSYKGGDMEVMRGVVIESMEPAEVPPGTRHLTSRVAITDRNGKPTGAQNVLSGCYYTWPPAGFGPTSTAAGLHLEPGERIAINHYVQGVTAGRWEVRGTRVRYREDGDLKTQTFHGATLEVFVDPAPNAPERAYACGEVPPEFMQAAPVR